MLNSVQELVSPTHALIEALKERDLYTADHSDRTSALATELGKFCGLSANELDLLHTAASVHDIGKIGIPDQVLLKPGRLDAAEWAIMKTHTERGSHLLSTIEAEHAGEVALAVRHHHEAFDGGGYPDGLRGEAIPFMARIISLADCYDAMATLRAYHHAHTHQSIMAIIHGENSKNYDPWLREQFARMIEASPHRVNR